MVMAYLSPHLSILLLLLAVLSSFTKSYLLIPQKETTNIDLFQSLLQIYEKAFIEVENMEESETYIKHFETKHYSYTNDIPVLILPHRFLPTIGYGNNLCRWLNFLACAHTAGFHVISININLKDQEKLPMDQRSSYSLKPTAFELALPSIMIHSNSTNESSKKIDFLKQCVHDSSSWEYYIDGGMYTQFSLLSSIGVTACDAYLYNRFGQNSSNYILRHDEFDVVHPVDGQESQMYPLFPDALIILRCADVLTWAGGYGFVNFHVYKRLIPASARTIYINSEPLVYNPMHHSQTAERQSLCRLFATELITFLRTHFPDALITIRRGDAHLSMIQIARSAVVISAPSTFTLLPGLANTHKNHKVYMQRTNLFAHNYNEELHMSPQFHWINSPKEIVFPNTGSLHDKNEINTFFKLLTDPDFELIFSNSTNR